MSRRAKTAAASPSNIFDEVRFYFGASVSDKEANTLTDLIEVNGGDVVRRWAKTVDYAVGTSSDDKKLENAVRDGVPRVVPAFIEDSVKAKKIVDPTEYNVDDEDEDEDDEDDENIQPNTAASKRKAAPVKKAVPAKKAAPVKKAEPVKKAAPAKRGRAAAKADDDDEEEEEESEPTKPAARGRAKAAAPKPVAQPTKRQRTDAASSAIAPAAGPDLLNDNLDDYNEDEDEDYEDEDEESSSDHTRVVVSNKAHKNSISVDAHVPMASNYVVLYDQGISFAYDFMLNQTNIGQNNNKFYLVQILQHTNGTYATFFRWGRVGAVGQTKLTSAPSKASAISIANSKVRDKSGYSISDYISNRNPQPCPKKYVYLERTEKNDDDDNDNDDDDDDDQDTVVKPVKSNLDPKVKQLIEMISDQDMINKQLYEIGYDARKLPLGKLSKDVIKNGYEALKDIEELLDEYEQLQKSKKLTSAQRQKYTEYFNELSSKFYTVIPHDFGRNRPQAINSAQLLKQKIELLDSLAEVEVAKTIIATSSRKQQLVEHPTDTKYKQLQCTINPVDPKSKIYHYIEQYVENTHGHTHSWINMKIIDIFELCRQSDEDRFDKYSRDIGNRQLLWHGSRLTNFVGILSSGLRIAPPEVPNTGAMFDKGIYTADAVSKSTNYCTTNEKNQGCILLCEVAMGDMEEMVHADYNASKHLTYGNISVKGMGKTVPNEDDAVYYDLYNTGKEIDKVKIPLGKLVNNPDGGLYLQYNEYIVYNVGQVKLKYLIRFENTNPIR